MTTNPSAHDLAEDIAIGESRSLWSVLVAACDFLTSPYRQPQSRLHGRARYGAGPAPVVVRMVFNPARA